MDEHLLAWFGSKIPKTHLGLTSLQHWASRHRLFRSFLLDAISTRCSSSSPAMAKPTLLQSFLGRPSQSYSFPQEQNYYSNKAHMRHIAAETGKTHISVGGEHDMRHESEKGIREQGTGSLTPLVSIFNQLWIPCLSLLRPSLAFADENRRHAG